MKKLLVTLVVAIMATLAISVVAFGEEISLYAQEAYAQEVVGFELESVGFVGIEAFGNGNNNISDGSGGGSGHPPPPPPPAVRPPAGTGGNAPSPGGPPNSGGGGLDWLHFGGTDDPFPSGP